MHRLSCRSVLPMIRLVRGFKEQKWAKQFLRGDIYMNTLGYFWNEGNVEQQDFLEGACASFDPISCGAFLKIYSVSLQKNRMQYREAQATVMCAAFRVSSLSK